MLYVCKLSIWKPKTNNLFLRTVLANEVILVLITPRPWQYNCFFTGNFYKSHDYSRNNGKISLPFAYGKYFCQENWNLKWHFLTELNSKPWQEKWGEYANTMRHKVLASDNIISLCQTADVSMFHRGSRRLQTYRNNPSILICTPVYRNLEAWGGLPCWVSAAWLWCNCWGFGGWSTT